MQIIPRNGPCFILEVLRSFAYWRRLCHLSPERYRHRLLISCVWHVCTHGRRREIWLFTGVFILITWRLTRTICYPEFHLKLHWKKSKLSWPQEVVRLTSERKGYSKEDSGEEKHLHCFIIWERSAPNISNPEDAKQTPGTEQAALTAPFPLLLCHHTGLSHQFLLRSLVYVTSADINGFAFQTCAEACLV